MPTHRPATKIHGLRVRAVHLEIAQPLETGSGTFASWPVVLLDLRTEGGLVGHAYVGCFLPMVLKPLTSLLADLGEMIAGEPLHPLDIERKLRAKMRLIGPQGLLNTAVALIEIAAWDALARVSDVPLAALFGAAPRSFPVYRTLVAMNPDKAAELAHQAVAAGYGGVKLKLGHPTVQGDLRLIDCVRKAVGADFPIMADYNQVLSVPAAMERMRTIDDQGLVWIEEPTAAADFAGHAKIAQAAHTPVQLGENWSGTADAQASLDLGASDYVMPDVIKIGGISAWLRSAALAEARGVPVSAHSFPEICAHLLCVAGSAHWLEHVGMADAVFQTTVRPHDGRMAPLEAPGLGIEWNEEVVSRFLVGDVPSS
jgi:mandelate racemase